MTSIRQIFLYSHGFATHADDNGLFSEISSFFPNTKHIMFEYDEWDDNTATATAATFSERAKKLKSEYQKICHDYPNAEINLICHSQGCNVAMLANLNGISRTILLCSPMVFGSVEEEYAHQKSKNCDILNDGTIIRHRQSGNNTIIHPNYFNDFKLLKDPQALCNHLNHKTQLIIIDALNDTVVKKDYSRLDNTIIIKHVDADHDLLDANSHRTEAEQVLREIFAKEPEIRHEKSCGCIIIDNNKVLLIGATDDSGKTFYGFPKGHQETGEDDITTALRETKEEVGLNVEIIDQIPIKTGHFIKYGTVYKDIYLFIAKPIDGEPTPQDGEVETIAWVDFDEVEKYFSPDYYLDAWHGVLKRIHK